MDLPAPARLPTLHFIGVTTGQSSIMRVFPLWAEALGLGPCRISGIDLPLHAPRDDYRRVVEFIRRDPLTRGALVTTHKIDLFAACRDLFDTIDPLARLMAEVSCLAKPAGRLAAFAQDPISAGLALDGFVPPGHFTRTGGALFALGAGGSAIAITWHLMRPARGADRPSRVIVADPDAARLAAILAVHAETATGVAADYRLIRGTGDNDALLAALPAGSLVVNATGLGKDRPGSPLGAEARFPEGGLVWELNYRGDLLFLAQASAQEAARRLTIADGWDYFIHGWTRAIAEVFQVEIPPRGRLIERLSALAGGSRPGAPAG